MLTSRKLYSHINNIFKIKKCIQKRLEDLSPFQCSRVNHSKKKLFCQIYFSSIRTLFGNLLLSPLISIYIIKLKSSNKFLKWCKEGDLNSHSFINYYPLKVARLPIPPSLHKRIVNLLNYPKCWYIS